MNIWYKLSLICGLAPLLLGCLIFLCWVAIRADWLMMVGVFNIFAGLVLFVCGLLFLFVYGLNERKKGSSYPIKRSLISFSILLVNFPAAVLAVYTADYVKSTSVATVINNSSFEAKDLVLIERDQTYLFPPIAPGQEVIKYFHFKYEGSVDFRLSLNKALQKGAMFGYVTAGMGGRATMVIKNDGTVEIHR